MRINRISNVSNNNKFNDDDEKKEIKKVFYRENLSEREWTVV